MSSPTYWDNEAYVSTHLVNEIFERLMPKREPHYIWQPEYKVPNMGNKKVDFCIEDRLRNIEFFIEVKSAKTKIDGAARFQLGEYLRNAKVRYGLLIDPFTIEIYEFLNKQITLKTTYSITDPTDVESAVLFLDHFLESIKMRTIAIHASKGGVGKTTLTVNIAYELARMGNRVLVVDLDDQANASLTLGVNKADEFEKTKTIEQYRTLLDYFKSRKEAINFMDLAPTNPDPMKLKECIYPAIGGFDSAQLNGGGKIDVLPGSYKIKPSALNDSATAYLSLNKGLQKLVGDYDYVVIDTTPSFNKITWNGLCAAKYVVIPSQMEYLSAFGIKNLLQNLNELQELMQQSRALPLGIVPTMIEHTNLHQTIRTFIEDWIPDIHFFSEIKGSTHIGNASHVRKPMSMFANRGNNPNAQRAAQQFIDLTTEIVNRIDLLERN
jgi:chromosome partitioning protein